MLDDARDAEPGRTGAVQEFEFAVIRVNRSPRLPFSSTTQYAERSEQVAVFRPGRPNGPSGRGLLPVRRPAKVIRKGRLLDSRSRVSLASSRSRARGGGSIEAYAHLGSDPTRLESTKEAGRTRRVPPPMIHFRRLRLKSELDLLPQLVAASTRLGGPSLFGYVGVVNRSHRRLPWKK